MHGIADETSQELRKRLDVMPHAGAFQRGLKLELARVRVEVLVIDSVSKKHHQTTVLASKHKA